ncbi:hypothetical protein [Novimethylophilus kurashikiensis]|nr:hypothetical protein [Novimethylophilus kurashikiensis]
MKLTGRREHNRSRSVVRLVVESSRDDRWGLYRDTAPADGDIPQDYSYYEPVYPRVPRHRSVSKTVERLSRNKIQARLYSAGIPSELAANLAKTIRNPLRQLAIKGSPDDDYFGEYVLGWNKSKLKQLLGKRLFKRVTRGVREFFYVLDEYGAFADQHFTEAMLHLTKAPIKFTVEGPVEFNLVRQA